MKAYGLYKNIRDASWQCLLDYEIRSLPVDLLAIAARSGIKVIKNSEVSILTGRESGRCILDGNAWYLVYDDEANLGRRRFTIAHELGHVLLGHALVHGYHGRTFDVDRPQAERDADMFAARLLAPACVLWGLDLHTPEEIANVCQISFAAARIRADRMRILYQRGKFLTHPLERRVYDQFREFIRSVKNPAP